MKTAECRGCGEPIIWVVTAGGKKMRLDAEPTSAGQYALEYEGETATARRVGEGYTGDRYESHFATCPSADQFRRFKRPRQ